MKVRSGDDKGILKLALPFSFAPAAVKFILGNSRIP